MELALSLGEPPTRAMEKITGGGGRPSTRLKLGYCVDVGVECESARGEEEEENMARERGLNLEEKRGSNDSPVQFNLLPLVRFPHHEMGFPWSTENRNLEASTRALDVNQTPSAEETAAVSSSPNSTVSSFQVEFAGVGTAAAAAAALELDRTSSRTSDEDDYSGSRKKLRLSKDQSAYLEESFKEHNTLNPKQKLALAKQLNLRPRQVEVWFQNRRARTKLKQTEVDCEYLKRCCETLKEENRRLQKELSELRALKTSQPFYMQLPATTLSMCPSCERVSSNTSSGAAHSGAAPSGTANPNSTNGSNNPSASDKQPPTTANFVASLFPKPRFYPFAHQPSAAS